MRGGFNAILRIACPYATPQSPNRDGLPRSIKELEYSLTLQTLDTNAANIVAISRYQYVRLLLLPARVVSAYAAPTLFAQKSFRNYVINSIEVYLEGKGQQQLLELS